MKTSKHIISRSLICIVCILSITFLPVTADAVGSKIFRAGEKVVKKHLQNKKPSSKPENSKNLGHYSTSAIRPFYEKMKSREDERCDTKKRIISDKRTPVYQTRSSADAQLNQENLIVGHFEKNEIVCVLSKRTETSNSVFTPFGWSQVHGEPFMAKGDANTPAKSLRDIKK